MQDEYEIKSSNDIESALLEMFGDFIEQALEAELNQRCLVHLIRQLTKFVSYQYRKSFCYDS
ncbi:MAG: hypothetical protein K2G70_02685 [Turicibacter sp.]|nr:hypothetical protein [Turicibacter sp.]